MNTEPHGPGARAWFAHPLQCLHIGLDVLYNAPGPCQAKQTKQARLVIFRQNENQSIQDFSTGCSIRGRDNVHLEEPVHKKREERSKTVMHLVFLTHAPYTV